MAGARYVLNQKILSLKFRTLVTNVTYIHTYIHTYTETTVAIHRFIHE
jgi:hypothetical protein